MEKRMKGKQFKLQGRQPSIKITISADVPDITDSPPETPPHLIQSTVRKLVSFGNAFTSEGSVTRVVVDESAIDFFPNCIDFGIKDFLTCKDEIDMELSSDTDTSFLEATPPHRFSDSEIDGQIEIMSITLDTALNMGPTTISLVKSETISKDDAFTTELNDGDDNQDDDDTGEICKLKDLKSNANPTDSVKKPTRLPPPRPFKRHISLPASIFMSYLLAEQNRALKENGSMVNIMHSTKQAWNDNGSTNIKNNRFATRKLTKIAGSYSSTDSTEDAVQGDSSIGSESSSYLNCYSDSTSNKHTLSTEELNDDDLDKQAFTSEIEKKSILLRCMRRLVRQDTTGNFAPPDYCI